MDSWTLGMAWWTVQWTQEMTWWTQGMLDNRNDLTTDYNIRKDFPIIEDPKSQLAKSVILINYVEILPEM